MIIDDDPDVRHALRLLLEMDGFDVRAESETGADGLAAAIASRPAFVIVDNRMPGGMDGATAARSIKAQVPGTTIVAFSGSVERTPEWADAHLRKDRITQIGALLEQIAR